jgi:hypothetical protein
MAKRNLNKLLDSDGATTGRGDAVGAADEKPDFLAAGAADLRRRAAACRVGGGGRDCRRLDAAAELIAPPPDDEAVEADSGTARRDRNAPAEPTTRAGATKKATCGEPARKGPPPEPDLAADDMADDEVDDMAEDADDQE